ncbi:MAG: methyltransferase domain-containing protein [Chitinivibrionales bacterium]|nr:methyltransferase domain-containing protein [Chitinivibrionales bacterium]
MSEIDVRKHFAAQAAEYESLMVRLIPRYLEQHHVVAELLPDDRDRQYRVLDLGCGNGVLAEVVLRKLPRAHVTGFDITDEMLQAFEHKVAAFTKSYRLVLGDYRVDSIGGSYDIVLAGLTLHHLTTDERRSFYGTLFASMNPGAVLVSRDVIIDDDDRVREHQYALWKQHMRAHGEDPEHWYHKHLAKDHPVTLGSMLSWMREAGFVEASCYWRLHNFAITRCRRSL